MKRNYINILIILLIFLTSIFIIRYLKIIGFCTILLSILRPLFYGFILSWILRPIVDKIKCNRVIITLIIYILFLGGITLILFNLIPVIFKELKNIIPEILNYINKNKYLNSIYNVLNINNIFNNNLRNMNNYVNNIFSIFLNIFYSLIFGFYFLSSKNNRGYFNFVPNKLRNKINKDLRLYIKSILLDTLFVFILIAIVFSVVDLNNSIIFALFCSITNIIPYIGPYIGGIPAVIIGLSKSFNFGITILIIIVVVQIIENNIVQPLLVSKNVKLNPISILLGIIIFSHFFGILGMIISTPIIIIFKNIIIYYKKNKPKWFNLILDKL